MSSINYSQLSIEQLEKLLTESLSEHEESLVRQELAKRFQQHYENLSSPKDSGKTKAHHNQREEQAHRSKPRESEYRSQYQESAHSTQQHAPSYSYNVGTSAGKEISGIGWYFEVLKKYAVFEGRARRKEYWYFYLFSLIAAFIAGFLDGMFWTGGVFYGLYSLAVLIPSIAVSIRRMHDVGKSGWFILIPIYNLILVLTPGEKGQNKFGPDPKHHEYIVA